jgi:hypothetical protein
VVRSKRFFICLVEQERIDNAAHFIGKPLISQ